MNMKYIRLILLFIVCVMVFPLNAVSSTYISSEDEKVKLLEVKIYPNPVSDKLNITFPETPDKEIQVKLVDITGRIAYSSVLRDKREFTLDFTGFSKGLYILNFFDENGEVLKISKIQKL